MGISVSFPNWSEALERSNLTEPERRRHRIIIQWYLGFLKREQRVASVESARFFVENLVEQRRPKDWQIHQWREGLNWFFREAPSRRRFPGRPERRPSEPAGVAETAGQPLAKGG